MKMEFDRDRFLKALQNVSNIVERKMTMPVLVNTLMTAKDSSVTLSATDLEVGIETTFPAKVSEPGSVCFPVKQVAEIVRQLPERSGRLSREENDWLSLTSGKAQFRVVGVPPEKFPEMPKADNTVFSRLRRQTLASAIGRTGYAMSTDAMRHNLNGAYIETTEGKGGKTFRMVATDGHRLAMFDVPLSDDETLRVKKGVILPRKGVAEIGRLLSESEIEHVEATVSDNTAVFRAGDTNIFMRLVAGDFPDYRSVVPKANKKHFRVSRDMFSDSLKRVSLLSEGRTKCVRLDLRDHGAHLAATTPELGEAEEDLSGEFDGGSLTIGFNARYLLDALAVTAGETVVLDLDEETSPGILRGADDPSVLGVIMPMRV